MEKGVFLGHFQCNTAIWHILWPFCDFQFGIVSLILAYRLEKYLATLAAVASKTRFCHPVKNGDLIPLYLGY
jgi:hypothetical protein